MLLLVSQEYTQVIQWTLWASQASPTHPKIWRLIQPESAITTAPPAQGRCGSNFRCLSADSSRHGEELRDGNGGLTVVMTKVALSWRMNTLWNDFAESLVNIPINPARFNNIPHLIFLSYPYRIDLYWLTSDLSLAVLQDLWADALPAPLGWSHVELTPWKSGKLVAPRVLPFFLDLREEGWLAYHRTRLFCGSVVQGFKLHYSWKWVSEMGQCGNLQECGMKCKHHAITNP